MHSTPKTLATPLALALILALLPPVLSGCSGEDLKKQLEQKNQLLAAQEGEIKKLKEDMAARDLDLKNQCEQRIQKLTAQNKHQVDALNARVAELSRKKEQDRSQKAEPDKSKSKSRR